MPNSYTCLQYHVIFSTKNRQSLITTDMRDRLYSYMGGIVTNEGGKLMTAGGVADHVHLLLSLGPKKSLADVMRVVKANSSKWVHETFPGAGEFGWQDGYAAFTVSLSAAPEVKAYIANQEAHHRRMSFEEELIAFMRRHGIAFDERYLLG